MLKTSLITLTLLLVGASSAWACPHGKKRFEKHDVNGDGKVTLEEMRSSAEAHFKKLDANGDGAVTAEEFKAAKKGKHGHGDAQCKECGEKQCGSGQCEHGHGHGHGKHKHDGKHDHKGKHK